MVPTDARGRRVTSWVEGAAWLGVAAVVTAALLRVRGHISGGHVALAYLLVVLLASARAGRAVGLVQATACFLAFNFFFVAPYGTLTVRDPLDWLVLLAFLATSAIAAQLLHRAQSATAAAERRARETQRLASLGAEALQAPRAEDAAVAIARVIREELHVERCELHLRDDASGHLTLVAVATATGVDGRSLGDDATRTPADVLLSADARTLLVPLRVLDHQVGVLCLRDAHVIAPDVASHPFARALAHYAALGLERIRLTTAASHADALREADRLKDAMLSAVSHDLRTPLTAIKAVAREIASGGEPRAEVIEAEADRLNRYVTNLLDLSRLNAGAVPVTPELVPVEDLIGAALQQVSSIAAGRELRVHLPPEGALLVGRLDFVLTLRALVNVLENALHYSAAGTGIDVHAHREGTRLCLEVADRGPGIAPADRARVFEPFQRGAGVGDIAGTGLGLPIARRLVEAQDGTLEHAARAGGGSVFTLTLPAAEVGALTDASL